MSVLAAVVTGTGSALGAPAAAGAATGPELKVYASDDTYTSSGRKDATFGTEDKLVIGRLAKDLKVSYLKFAVPAGTSVTGARLKLTTVGGVTGKVTVNRVVNNAWTEKKITSATAPALGLAVATATPKSSETQVSFDLGAEVTGPGTYSFAVRSSSATAVTRFRSAEATSGRPELTVTTAAAAPVEKPAPVETPAPADTTPAPVETPTDYIPGADLPVDPAPVETTPAPAETPAETTARRRSRRSPPRRRRTASPTPCSCPPAACCGAAPPGASPTRRATRR
jgi:hypothetical protein